MSPKPPVSLWPDPEALGPLTDLYQLTMMAGYHAAGMAGQTRRSSCSYAKMPPGRAFLVFAGLEQAIGDLLDLAFDPEQIDEIRRWPAFRGRRPPRSWTSSPSTRFEGDVCAVPEGTVVFPGETLVRVTAPLPQAQWVETHLLASTRLSDPGGFEGGPDRRGGRRKVALRVRRPARPRAARPALMAARSAMIAGFDATSHVEAARRLGMPAVGTMAHSWVQSFDDRVRSIRDVRPGLSRKHHATGRHLRHARRRSSGRRDRPAGPGHSNRQRRLAALATSGSRDPRPARPAEREDRRSRAISTNTGSHELVVRRRADRRLRSRNRIDHLRATHRPCPWCTSSSSSMA